MAFGDRLRSAVGRLGRALVRIAGQPAQPQAPAPQPQAPGPRVYEVAPQEGAMRPTDFGSWVPIEPTTQAPQPVYGEYITEPSDWEGYEEEITLYDAIGEELEVWPEPWPDWNGSYNDWYRLSTEFPASYLREVYGFNNIDILESLEEQGYEVDWDMWKQDYEASY